MKARPEVRAMWEERPEAKEDPVRAPTHEGEDPLELKEDPLRDTTLDELYTVTEPKGVTDQDIIPEEPYEETDAVSSEEVFDKSGDAINQLILDDEHAAPGNETDYIRIDTPDQCRTPSAADLSQDSDNLLNFKTP